MRSATTAISRPHARTSRRQTCDTSTGPGGDIEDQDVNADAAYRPLAQRQSKVSVAPAPWLAATSANKGIQPAIWRIALLQAVCIPPIAEVSSLVAMVEWEFTCTSSRSLRRIGTCW